MHRWVENEDWVEFYRPEQFASVGNGRYETLARFCGPMASVDYHFWARVSKGAERIVEGVEVEGEPFHWVGSPADVPGTPPGYAWVYLGHISTGRAYRKLTLTAPHGLADLERICVLQVPQRLESGAIERRIARELAGDPEPLSGVPLGGVGAGKLEICRDGFFRNITINGNIDAPIWRSDGTFFVVRAVSDGGAQVRVISTEGLHGLPPVERLDFDGVYPTAILRADDRELPLLVEVRASGTIIPRNVEDSALPLALFTVRIQAREGKPVEATVAFCVENFLGCGGGLAPGLAERHTLEEGFYEVWEEREGNVEHAWQSGGFGGVLFDGGAKEEKRSEGQHVLATDSPVVSRLTGWRMDDSSEPWRVFASEGRFPEYREEPSAGERTAGAIMVEVDLQPGESREIRFVFAWHVPVFRQSPVAEYGHFYSNVFAGAGDVAKYGLEHFDRLWADASEVPGLLLSSSLPEWLARSLANDAYVFSTASWLTKDGRFAVNEGPTQMFGCMGTLDQKLYANHYFSLFFPELDRTELLGFARAQAENGGIQHDLGGGHLETRGQYCDWPDLTCALAILSLKHYQFTGDQEYIDEVYPPLVRAILDYHRKMDHDDDGLADGPEVGNTFDAEHFEGVSCYTATLTLAALKALENLAARRGDAETAARCRERFAKARESAVRMLWNGRWFVSYHNPAAGKTNGNCHLSQLAGELFARLCGLGGLYDDAQAREALAATLRLNYPPDLIFPTNEATPEGRMPFRQIWGWLPHARACLGGLPAYFGMAEQGLQALERMDRVIAEINGDNRWDQRLFYEPDTGRQHWGRFYMSAPATWLAYQALLGYTWDKPAGRLGIVPNVPDSLLPLRAPVFLPDLWAWLEVSADRRDIRLSIVKRLGSGPRLRSLRVPALPGDLTLLTDGEAAPFRRVEAGPERGWDELETDVDLDAASELRLMWKI